MKHEVMAMLLVFIRDRRCMSRADSLSELPRKLVPLRKRIHPEVMFLGADLPECVVITQRCLGQVLQFDRHSRHRLGKLKTAVFQQRLCLPADVPKAEYPTRECIGGIRLNSLGQNLDLVLFPSDHQVGHRMGQAAVNPEKPVVRNHIRSFKVNAKQIVNAIGDDLVKSI